MRISGLQKMTLLDYPGKVACTVFLGGCNYRCPFCHNSELLDGGESVMSVKEFLAFLEKRRGLLDAVCVSGGEPTLQAGLPEFLEKIKSMGYLTKLDTNGSRPEVIKDLAAQGLLDYVAMDIKNCPAGYALTAGTAVKLENIEESIRFLTGGAVDYEFRTTVTAQHHDEEAILQMGQWAASLARGEKIKRWFVQPFVDRDTVAYAGLSKPNEGQLAEFVVLLSRFSLQSDIRG